MDIFKKRLKEEKVNRFKTNKALADATAKYYEGGISESLISKYMNPEQVHEPSLEKLKALCQALNVSADYLLGITNQKENLTIKEIMKETNLSRNSIECLHYLPDEIGGKPVGLEKLLSEDDYAVPFFSTLNEYVLLKPDKDFRATYKGNAYGRFSRGENEYHAFFPDALNQLLEIMKEELSRLRNQEEDYNAMNEYFRKGGKKQNGNNQKKK